MIEPYLNFNGQAAEAVDFYEAVFGGTDKKIFRFEEMRDNPAAPSLNGEEGWIDHAELTVNGTKINFCDMRMPAAPSDMVSLMLHCETPEELAEIYKRLMAEGTAIMEMGPQFFARMYAWVRDKFGVGWQLICE